MELDDIIVTINGANIRGDLNLLLGKKAAMLRGVEFHFLDNVASSEYRWYTVDTNIYEAFYRGQSLGILEIMEVGMVKSEFTKRSDCEFIVRAKKGD